jgi:hypothetical protein
MTDTIWDELELVAQREGSPGGIVERMVHPEAKCDMFAAVDKSSMDRLFLVHVAPTGDASLPELPCLRGLSLRYLTWIQSEHSSVVLELRAGNHEYARVFAIVAEDLADCASQAGTRMEAVDALIRRLTRWQRFLERAGSELLSVEERRGLFGELTVLCRLLDGCSLPGSAVVSGWHGPLHANHDFEYANCSIEVKTSSAKQEQRLRISSERQLDWSQAGRLLLAHVSVAEDTEEGTSLPSLVSAVRSRLEAAQAADQFDDLLLRTGYLRQDEDAYSHPMYLVRKCEAFHVRDGFPCILESDLRAGVGDVTYSIGTGSCSAFSIPFESLISSVEGKTHDT